MMNNLNLEEKINYMLKELIRCELLNGRNVGRWAIEKMSYEMFIKTIDPKIKKEMDTAFTELLDKKTISMNELKETLNKFKHLTFSEKYVASFYYAVIFAYANRFTIT